MKDDIDPEKNQIISVGLSKLLVRSRSLVRRGLSDLELNPNNRLVSTEIEAEREISPTSELDLLEKYNHLLDDPKAVDLLIDLGTEYYNNNISDRSEWHASMYAEAENLAEGFGDVIERIFPDIWEAITREKDYLGGTKGKYGSQILNKEGFKPDYGLRLVQEGVSSEVDLHFYDFRLYCIKSLGAGQFTTTVEIPYAGKPHALSLDFNKVQLDKILSRASPHVRKYIENQLATDPGPLQTIYLKDCICFSVRARLRKIEKVPKENFVPLIAQEILDR